MSSSDHKAADNTNTVTIKEYQGGDLTPLTAEELVKLHDWNFNILYVPELHDKFRFVQGMFDDVNLFAHLPIDKAVFKTFLYNLSLHYDQNTNPFHNFNHGITVAHGIYYMIRSGIVEKQLNSVETFALLFSALCHDVAHTGHSNAYETNSESKIFQAYGKASVTYFVYMANQLCIIKAVPFQSNQPLEKHHIAMTLLIADACGLFKNVQKDDLSTVELFVRENILATDMSKHNDIMNEFKQNIPKLLASVDGKDLTQAEKLNLCGALVHAADIGAPTRDFSISKEWSIRISKEFVNQVALEEQNHIQVTAFYKGLDQYLQVAKNEIGFINFFIKPFWLEVKRYADGKLEQVEDNIVKNVESWQVEYQSELERTQQAVNGNSESK